MSEPHLPLPPPERDGHARPGLDPYCPCGRPLALARCKPRCACGREVGVVAPGSASIGVSGAPERPEDGIREEAKRG